MENNIIFWGSVANIVAILIAIALYVADRIREKLVENELKKYLINELFNDLLFVNTNLRKIKKFRDNPDQDIHGFCHISNDIFYALINSSKIVITKGAFAPLMSFYNCDQTIRNVISRSEQLEIHSNPIPSGAFAYMVGVSDGNGSLVENKFLEMKTLLKEIFKVLHREKDYLQWQDKGLEEWQEYLKSLKISEHSAKNPTPQIFQ